MMNHGSIRSRRARSTHFAVTLTTLFLALTASTLMTSNDALAATGPKVVWGYIWDNAGNLVEGTDVTVNILAQSDSSVRATDTDTTLADGEYFVTFSLDQWDIGDTIEVIATYDSRQADPNSSVATSVGVQWVNVSFEFEIPEFGSYLGLLIAGGAIGIVGVAVVSMKRRR